MTGNSFFSPYIWPSAFTIVLLTILAAYSWQKRAAPAVIPFFLGCVFAILWAIGSTMEYASSNPAMMVFWAKFQAIWQLPTITAVTCFALEYIWPGRWLNRRNLILLSIVPILVLVLILTSDLHQIMWTGFTFSGAFTPLIGIGGWFAILYGYALGVANVIIYIYLFLHSPQHRWPVAIILAALIQSQIIYGLEVFEGSRFNLPLDMFAIAIVFLMLAVAQFSFCIHDPIPVARQTVVAQMHEGMLVLDKQGRITSLNPSAEKIFNSPAKNLLYQPFKDLLPEYTTQITHLLEQETAKAEIVMGNGSNKSYYALMTSCLEDWRGVEMGRLILMYDSTEQKHAHLQFVEQQRAQAIFVERERLARELHDSLGQVFAFINTQGQTIKRVMNRGELETANEFLNRLIQVAMEADVDIRESILGLRVAMNERGFFSALEQFLNRYARNYDIHTELFKDDSFTDDSFDRLVELQLLRIIQEALNNIRKHAGACSVKISFVPEQGCQRLPCACITIEDDGAGFDPQMPKGEQEKHVGLRVMRERANEVGGRLSVFSEPSKGTKVVVWVPLQAETSPAQPEEDRPLV